MANTDDYLGSVNTTGRLTTAAPVNGVINFVGDQDWFKTTLVAGVTYTFNMVQTPKTQFYNLDSYLRLLNSVGQTILSDDDSGGTRNAWIRYTPATSGDYFLSAEGNYYSVFGVVTGPYELSVWANHAPVVTGKAASVGAGQTIPLSSLFSVTDSDGDSIVTYVLYFPVGGGSLHWSDGSVTWNETLRKLTVPASSLGTVTLTGDFNGTEVMQVAASDGLNWSAWSNASVTVKSSDILAPTVSWFSPADEATDVALGSNIVLTFNEPIARGTGNIVLKTTAGAIVAVYDAASSPNISIAGKALTIDPTSTLSSNVAYKVEFPTGSIKDLTGNSFVGTANYNFTTGQASLGTTSQNVLVAAINLSARAYSDAHYQFDTSKENTVDAAVTGWSTMSPADFRVAGTGSFTQLLGGNLLRYDNENASATVGLTLLGNKRTLGISFEGTNFGVAGQEKDLWDDLVDIGNHAKKLSVFMKSVADYVTNHPSIEQVLVTGHSLGGAMAQEFMSLYGVADSRYVGVTFGSPGTTAPNPALTSVGRMVNFSNTNDLIPSLGQNGITFDATLLTASTYASTLSVSDLFKSATSSNAGSGASAAIDTVIDVLTGKTTLGQVIEANPKMQAAANYFGIDVRELVPGLKNALVRPNYKVVGSVVNLDLDWAQNELPLSITEHALVFSTATNPTNEDVSYAKSIALLTSIFDSSIFFQSRDFTLGTGSGETLASAGQPYAMLGGGGNDVFLRSPGSNRIYGGDGADTVLYPGKQSEYSVKPVTVSIVDATAVPETYSVIAKDGTDTLRGIEYLQFGDGNKIDIHSFDTKPISFSSTNGNDSFTSGQGNDAFDGGNGVDTVVFNGVRSGYNISKNSNGWIVVDSNGRDGTDTLQNIERLKFSNGGIALDVGATQSGGQTQLLLGAVLGKDLLATKRPLIGIVIDLFDQGFTLQQLSGALMRLDIWGLLANAGQPGATNTQIANYLLTTVNKATPDPVTLAAAVTALNTETSAAQGNFLWHLAESAANQDQVGLVGLAATGLEFGA